MWAASHSSDPCFPLVSLVPPPRINQEKKYSHNFFAVLKVYEQTFEKKIIHKIFERKNLKEN
jgi:hypothetical protein